MKKILFLPFVLLLSGCFSLKTPLPEVSYYDLDFNGDTLSQCQIPTFFVGISEIRASSLYENQNILLKKKSGEVISESRVAWVDAPKNLIKKALIGQFSRQCIGFSIPPFGGIKNDFLLKLELLNFEITQGSEGDFVHIALFYEFVNLKTFKVFESGVIAQKERLKDYVSSFGKAIEKVSLRLAQKTKELNHK